MSPLYSLKQKLPKVSLLFIGLWLGSLLFNCGDPFVRVPAKLPGQKKEKVNWATVLAKPSPVRLQTLHTGWVTVPTEGMLDPEHPRSKKLVGTETMEVRVFAHLIRHPKYGLFLIDSGLDSSYQQQGNIGGFIASNYILSYRQKKNQAIGAALKNLGVDPSQLQGVLFTHFHGDHTAGAPDLPGGLRYYAGQGDTYHNIPLVYTRNHLDHVNQVRTIDVQQGQPAPIFGHAVDFLGDGTVWVVATPGHSKGHLSFIVVAKGGAVLLTGDASHTKVGFDHNITPGWLDDKQAAQASLKKLRRFKELHPQTTVIYGHQYPDGG